MLKFVDIHGDEKFSLEFLDSDLGVSKIAPNHGS